MAPSSATTAANRSNENEKATWLKDSAGWMQILQPICFCNSSASEADELKSPYLDHLRNAILYASLELPLLTRLNNSGD